MFKTTEFIAVQCCQCSTMQVKQKKKSSSKWTCAVCNQKQSLLKVFSHGYIAKDLRKFVQSFNMSRKFSDDAAAASDCDPPPSLPSDDWNSSPVDQRKTRRTDWTEYIDDDDDDNDGNAGIKSPDVEPEIVTELPEKMFKKPKLSCNYKSSAAYQPHFSNRSAKSNWNKQAKHTSNYLPRSATEGSRQDEYIKGNLLIARKGVSKWNAYIAEEDDDGSFKARKDVFANDENRSGLQDVETTCGCAIDQSVDEDVHPDFM